MPKTTKKGKIAVDRELCKGCHICIEVCPNNRIEVDESLNNKGYSPARPKENVSEGEKGCVGCAMCATVCPAEALSVRAEEESLTIAFDPRTCTACGQCVSH